MADGSGSIVGPVTWLPASDPPTFDIFANGHAFWMVELSAAPELMDPSAENQRADDNYYFGSDQPGAFAAGGTWTIPQDVWDRVGLAGRLFYRLYTSESDTGFVDWTISVDDPSGGEVPFIEIGADSPDPVDGGNSSSEADVAALVAYLHISRDDFDADQDRYFARLGELLSFHQVVGGPADVDPGSFRAAVRDFQNLKGLAADGIPGEDTLWELNRPWALANRLDLVRIDMDDGAPPGQPHRDDQHGYLSIRVRSDIADAVAGLREDLNAAGVLMTSSGATRNLDATVTAGRSSTSIHYSAAAVDLATTMGVTTQGPVPPAAQPYLITEESGRWRVWSRSDSGNDETLEVVEWSGGAVSTRTVEGRFFDVTTAAQARGLQRIGPRSTFPGNYLSAEWWHFQSSDVLIPWVCQFGAEILRLTSNDEATFQAQQGLWDARKNIFHRGVNGWW